MEVPPLAGPTQDIVRRLGARQDTHIRENRSTWSSQVGRPHIEQDMVVGDWHTWHIAASIGPPQYGVREEVVVHPSARGSLVPASPGSG